MKRAPIQFDTIVCMNCGAIVALIPPGAIIVTTKLRCIYCSIDRTIKPVDRERSAVYTSLQQQL